MKLGDIANEEAARFGKPLDGIRVLSAEQMQALPFATQLLGRLGADVVKVEHPTRGESGRGSTPSIDDPDGRPVGATYLRNNFGKSSIGLDLQSEEGRDLFLRMVPNFDVVAENFKAGTMHRLGLGPDVIAAANPRAVVVSLSGFGNTLDSPYRAWPAYASIVEAMSGIYDYKRAPGDRPTPNPMGAVGDITSAMFAVVGILAALRHREATGEGQYVDIAMLDCMVALTDLVMNFNSLGIESEPHPAPFLIEPIQCSDGFAILQIVRENQFRGMADVVGHPEWKDDPRFAERTGWTAHLDAVLRPAIEEWSRDVTRTQFSDAMSIAGVVTGPVLTSSEIIADAHLAARDMIVEMERPDDSGPPVLSPGNPVKLSKVARGPETRVPWLGEHTDSVLTDELGLTDAQLMELRASGVIG
ncbi:MAG: CaiB/BaiF CoA-transferase family protein [Acidimicrobiia bacterium]|nr:CaiB/BaiF CoA-transferase family protein [Acidimicrobiia bacterium]